MAVDAPQIDAPRRFDIPRYTRLHLSHGVDCVTL
jgi:hypothetical protein